MFFIVTYLVDDDYWLAIQIFVWQTIHMYILGRKSITLENFDAIDFIAGIISLVYFIQAPAAYLVMPAFVYLAFDKPSIKY